MNLRSLAVAALVTGLTLACFAAEGPSSQAQPAGQAGRCPRFSESRSSAFDPATQTIHLPWRSDLPTSAPAATHAWEAVPLADWRNYMAAVLSEVRAGGLVFANQRVSMSPTAQWWITPWLDYTTNGREQNNGLTRERSPDPGDLAPSSPGGLQVWAVGFYNREGAFGLGQVYADPCNPQIPTTGWKLPNDSASFKLLFTTATAAQIPYLAGAPEVSAFVDKPGGGRSEQTLRLLQMDIAVRDPRSPTQWVLGTYVWKGPKTGDGMFDNLTPVGLMWGNNPSAAASPRDAFATLSETRLNPQLAGVVWRGPGQTWPGRPWPGFQGRLNGPADNLRSSCLSCHALAQWPRSPSLGIVPTGASVSLAALNTTANRTALRTKYLKNVVGGTLTVPSEATAGPNWGGARPLDYSMQLEAGLTRMCRACRDGAMSGATPAVCRVPGAANFVAGPTCPPAPEAPFGAMSQPPEPPARQ